MSGKLYNSERDLPFYPTYNTETCGPVHIWWFVREFCQSRFNHNNTPNGSNACTIITVLLCARLYYNQINISPTYNYELPPDVVYAFAESILEGNDIHDQLRKSGSLQNINLTVPEAIESAGPKLKSITEWVSLMDSHQHMDHGAFIAQVPRTRLKALCNWFDCLSLEYFNSQPECYELTFLYFQKSKHKHKAVSFY